MKFLTLVFGKEKGSYKIIETETGQCSCTAPAIPHSSYHALETDLKDERRTMKIQITDVKTQYIVFGDENCRYRLTGIRYGGEETGQNCMVPIVTYMFELRKEDEPGYVFAMISETALSDIVMESVFAQAVKDSLAVIGDALHKTVGQPKTEKTESLGHLYYCLEEVMKEAGKPVIVTEKGMEILPAVMKLHVKGGRKLYEIERSKNGESLISIVPVLDRDCISAHIPSAFVCHDKSEKPKTYRFSFDAYEDIQADNLNKAIEMFHVIHPECKENDLNHIIHNGVRLPYEYSKTTSERIYYEPGCPVGAEDCILDPMRDVAKACEHQSDMTPDKYVTCEDLSLDKNPKMSDHCYNYDDECK